MSKPFFYRITAADFLAAVVTVPEGDRAAWVLSLALDMVSADVDNAKSQFAKDIISEAGEYKERRANAGKKGGLAKASNAKQCLAKPSLPLASSSSSSSTVTEKKKTYSDLDNVLLTDKEYEKLKEKFNGGLDSHIENLSLYIASKGKKYKSHYATILAWSRKNTNNEEENKPRGPKLT